MKIDLLAALDPRDECRRTQDPTCPRCGARLDEGCKVDDANREEDERIKRVFDRIIAEQERTAK